MKPAHRMKRLVGAVLVGSLPIGAIAGDPELKLDRVWLEAGGFFGDGRADSSQYGNLAASARWDPAPQWEVQLGARADGYWQTGDLDFSGATLDYTENFVRYRSNGTRVTVGTQKVVWGRADVTPPTDRLSRVDASRFFLDDLSDRRRAVPGIRLENYFTKEFKADFFAVPFFDPAVLANQDSVWYPVNRQAGRIILAKPLPGFDYLVRNGSFGEDDGGAGGAGLRLTYTGDGIDYGLSVQRARQSLPYYRLDPALAGQLQLGASAADGLAATSGDTFTAIHPYTWVGGGEIELDAAGATWRVEAAYLSDVPLTSRTLDYFTAGGVDWMAGVEVFPGDGDTRATLQVTGHQLFTGTPTIDLGDYYAVNGELEHTFGHGSWRAGLRFNVGLNVRDVYVNPQLTYVGLAPHEIYVGAHFFSGDSDTAGGFHQDDDLAVLGWQVRY
jgi:hypothetical protein